MEEPKNKDKKKKLEEAFYLEELIKLQVELVKLQEWIKEKGLKVVVIFEGRDAAGKGGTISRIVEKLNPRICRIVALAKPTEREQTQWYFQRYVAHLPAAGEMVLFDRSWYNRAVVERVMGFCKEDEYWEFLRSCPNFEQMLIRSGIILIKYWKFSEIDLNSYEKWDEYSQAKDEMFTYTDTKQSPWYVVSGDDKRRSRLNCISHLLSMVPYEYLPHEQIDLPERKSKSNYVRPPMSEQTFVPDLY